MNRRTRKTGWLKSLQKQGLRPELRLICETDASRVNELERFWIAYYRIMVGEKLTNTTAGGDGVIYPTPAAKAAAIERHRQTMLGRKASPEARRKMSETSKLRAADPKERERLRSISNRKPPVHSGENNPMAKLSDQEVRQLRIEASEGASGVELARRYGTSTASVWEFVTGKVRAAAGGPIRPSKPRQKLTDQQVEQIRARIKSGEKRADLAEEYGIHGSHISHIMAGRRH